VPTIADVNSIAEARRAARAALADKTQTVLTYMPGKRLLSSPVVRPATSMARAPLAAVLVKPNAPLPPAVAAQPIVPTAEPAASIDALGLPAPVSLQSVLSRAASASSASSNAKSSATTATTAIPWGTHIGPRVPHKTMEKDKAKGTETNLSSSSSTLGVQPSSTTATEQDTNAERISRQSSSPSSSTSSSQQQHHQLTSPPLTLHGVTSGELLQISALPNIDPNAMATVSAILSPQNGSQAELRRLNRATVQALFARHKHDTGSSEVQAAMCSLQIDAIQSHLDTNPKDKKAKLKLQHIVDKRRKILKYLKRTDFPACVEVCKAVGLDLAAVY
jgi:small subunit ribosomal protein S15